MQTNVIHSTRTLSCLIFIFVESGRVMELYSDQPGVQFYTGHGLPEGRTLKGKTGYIQKHGAFCLETQIYPDAINQVNCHTHKSR